MTISQANPGTVSSLSSDEAVADESATTTNLIEVIETVIDSLDHDNTAMVSYPDGGGHIWKFKYGTVEVFVQLTGQSEEDTLTTWATVLKLPTKDDAQLMRHLLEMNWSGTLEARFGIFDGAIVILSSRTLADLSPGEVSRAITLVASLADENDEPLQAKFGVA